MKIFISSLIGGFGEFRAAALGQLWAPKPESFFLGCNASWEHFHCGE